MTPAERRRALTQRLTRCPCGNIARNGSALCGNCEDAKYRERERNANREAIITTAVRVGCIRGTGEDFCTYPACLCAGRSDMLRAVAEAVLDHEDLARAVP